MGSCFNTVKTGVAFNNNSRARGIEVGAHPKVIRISKVLKTDDCAAKPNKHAQQSDNKKILHLISEP